MVCCITRDAFEFDEEKNFEVTHYSARSSLATLAFEPIQIDLNLSALTSSFQKKMIIQDSQRALLNNINSKDYDLIIFDFIDERFNLININNIGYITESSEFKNCKLEETAESISYITAYSDEYKNYFIDGFKKLITQLREKNLINNFFINKAYWSTKDNNNNDLSNIDYINKSNLFLDWIYSTISSIEPNINFINYEEKFFRANKEHKWGVAPFHYIDEFYIQSINYIKDICKNKIYLNEFSFNHSIKNNLINFNALIECDHDVEYAIYISQ